jgi:hypothetical protein
MELSGLHIDGYYRYIENNVEGGGGINAVFRLTGIIKVKSDNGYAYLISYFLIENNSTSERLKELLYKRSQCTWATETNWNVDTNNRSIFGIRFDTVDLQWFEELAGEELKFYRQKWKLDYES